MAAVLYGVSAVSAVDGSHIRLASQVQPLSTIHDASRDRQRMTTLAAAALYVVMPHQVKDVQWASWTTTTGWPVQGESQQQPL